MGKGSIIAGESVATIDERTGARVWQVTNHPGISHNLYFLASSVMPDGENVIFCSYRDGQANFYLAPFRGGPMRQLTEAEGINGYSAIIDRNGEHIYFSRGGEVRSLDLRTLAEKVLASYFGTLGEVSLNADGSLLVAALGEANGFALTVTPTSGSGGRVILRSARTLIHPQFHPRDPTLIEYAADPAPRMWLVRADGSANECLWQHGDDEFLVHEVFMGSGDDLAVVRWPYALQRFSLARREMNEIAAFNAWHISPSRDGRIIVCDTVHPDIGLRLVDTQSGRHCALCYPASSCRGTQWRTDRYAGASEFQRASAGSGDAGAGRATWMEMKGDTVYGPQWTHPHPAWSFDERFVAFTSDRSGFPQVYVAEVPEGLRERLVRGDRSDPNPPA